MIERKIGNRGSKSDLKSVKEQRVDGGWHKVELNSFVFKVYSNGFRNKLSDQNPFKTSKFLWHSLLHRLNSLYLS